MPLFVYNSYKKRYYAIAVKEPQQNEAQELPPKEPATVPADSPPL